MGASNSIVNANDARCPHDKSLAELCAERKWSYKRKRQNNCKLPRIQDRTAGCDRPRALLNRGSVSDGTHSVRATSPRVRFCASASELLMPDQRSKCGVSDQKREGILKHGPAVEPLTPPKTSKRLQLSRRTDYSSSSEAARESGAIPR